MIIAALTWATPVPAAERNLQFAELPEVVQKAAREIVQDAKVLKVLEEKEKMAFYTVEYAGRAGRTFEVEISPKGQVLERGELIAVADAPEAARKVIEEKTKSFSWKKVIKASHEGQTVYVVKFDRGGDDEGQFTVNAKGKVLSE